MEKKLNYLFVPSLKHIGLVKIATTLWKQENTRASTVRFNFLSSIFRQRHKEWQALEGEVIKPIPELLLPKSLNEELLNLITPIGLEILRWTEYHKSYLNERSLFKYLNWLLWTPQGTIDKKGTAGVMVKDDNLDVTTRYVLACINCLEEDIRTLWNKIPEDCRESFYNQDDPTKVVQDTLVVLWTYDIKGEVNKLDLMIRLSYARWQRKSPYQYAFEYAVDCGNKAATVYFLQKLTPKEREESLVSNTGHVSHRRCYSPRICSDLSKEHFSEILCFLLSQVDAEEQINVLKGYPFKVLKCLLDWPLQTLFMGTANIMWDFLPFELYHLLLRTIVDKMIDGHKDCNYQKLFAEFWQRSPNHHKRYVIKECAIGILLSKLFKIKDRNNIKSILEHAYPMEKESLIFSDEVKDTCVDLINGEEWGLFEFLIRECVHSKIKVLKFKEELEDRLKLRCVKHVDLFYKFFQLIDNLISVYDSKKRTLDDNLD